MNYQTHGQPVDPRLAKLLQAMLAQKQYQTHADGGSTKPMYVDAQTRAPGRADNIDAKLSENEYVIDAETMALLGDGNPDAGAEKMDAFRANIRKHKGEYLTHGEISPDALDPMQYLDAPVKKAGGGKVGKFRKAIDSSNMRKSLVDHVTLARGPARIDEPKYRKIADQMAKEGDFIKNLDGSYDLHPTGPFGQVGRRK